jgi:hypothetical protein
MKASLAWPARDVPACHRKQGEIQIEAKFSQKNGRNFTFVQSMRIVFLGMERKTSQFL